MKARPAILYVQWPSWSYHSLQGQHLDFFKVFGCKMRSKREKIKYKSQNFETCILYFWVLYFIFWDSRFCTTPLKFMVLTQNLAAKWIRYGCTLSILRADFSKKTIFSVFRTKSAIPNIFCLELYWFLSCTMALAWPSNQKHSDSLFFNIWHASRAS